VLFLRRLRRFLLERAGVTTDAPSGGACAGGVAVLKEYGAVLTRSALAASGVRLASLLGVGATPGQDAWRGEVDTSLGKRGGF